MTENEAIEVLKEKYRTMSMCLDIDDCKRNNQAISKAIEAMEKQKAKTPDVWGDGYDEDGNMIYDMYDCPSCGESYEIDYHKYAYCPNCGQKLDMETIYEEESE